MVQLTLSGSWWAWPIGRLVIGGLSDSLGRRGLIGGAINSLGGLYRVRDDPVDWHPDYGPPRSRSWARVRAWCWPGPSSPDLAKGVAAAKALPS